MELNFWGLKIVPVFSDPETGSSWSGRGKMPIWLTQKIAGGKTLEDFRNHSAQAGSPVRPEQPVAPQQPVAPTITRVSDEQQPHEEPSQEEPVMS